MTNSSRTNVYEIQSIRSDRSGTYYALEDDAPLKGITVNELDGEVTIHPSDAERLFPYRLSDISATDIARTLAVLEILRDDFQQDNMVGPARTLNKAHALVDDIVQFSEGGRPLDVSVQDAGRMTNVCIGDHLLASFDEDAEELAVYLPNGEEPIVVIDHEENEVELGQPSQLE